MFQAASPGPIKCFVPPTTKFGQKVPPKNCQMFEGAHLNQICCLKGAHLIQIVKCLRGAHLSQIHGLNFKGGTFDSNPKIFEGAHLSEILFLKGQISVKFVV